MCGICGVYGFEDKNLIKKMCNEIKHRGPDDEGFFCDDNINLGHKRLSIIDIKGGHQPIHNEDNTIWIIFNGEIYNYKEIREKIKANHTFYTDSDTEVIIHAYEEYGLDFINQLNGMFAFALWDSSNEQLILARDPIGKKPLYYFWDGNNLFFASEIKALFQTQIPKQIDFNSLCSFLGYGYTIGENSIFKNIKKVLGGHYLILKNKKLEIRKYWDIKEKFCYYDEEFILKQLIHLLAESIRYRMISDVPIGAFLSGGLDSSTVVALSRSHVDYPYHTFSVGFDNFSELEFAKTVSDAFNTEHHEIFITPQKVIPELDKIAWHYDEPLGDAAIINNYFLSREAKKYVKVVLAGEAGDEIFAGYPNYKFNLNYYNYFKIPLLNNLIKSTITIFPNRGNFYKNTVSRYLNYFGEPTFEKAHQYTTRVFNDDEIHYLTDLNVKEVNRNTIFPERINDPLNIMLALDCKNLLPEKFLMKADKATMANSIEERLPLMDKNIIDFAFSIPSNLKLNNFSEKYILKKAMKNILPDSIINRKKQGFGTPLTHWLNHPQFKELLLQELTDNLLIKKIFKDEKMEFIIKNIKNSKINDSVSPKIWNLFSLSLWYNVWFK